VLSAHNKPDQRMWLDGFQAFFSIKQKLEILLLKSEQNGAKIGKLDFSMNPGEKFPQGIPTSSRNNEIHKS